MSDPQRDDESWIDWLKRQCEKGGTVRLDAGETLEALKELRLMAQIVDVAGWTEHGSRIYKDPLQVSVSRDWYGQIHSNYTKWYKEYGYERHKAWLKKQGLGRSGTGEK